MRNISKNILVQWRNYSFERTEELKEKKDIHNNCGKIRMEITLKWQKRWETEMYGRNTYKFIKDVNFQCTRN